MAKMFNRGIPKTAIEIKMFDIHHKQNYLGKTYGLATNFCLQTFLSLSDINIKSLQDSIRYGVYQETNEVKCWI